MDLTCRRKKEIDSLPFQYVLDPSAHEIALSHDEAFEEHQCSCRIS